MCVIKRSLIVIKVGQFDGRQVWGILFSQQVIFQGFLIIRLGIFVKIAIVPKPQSQCSVSVLRRMGFQHGQAFGRVRGNCNPVQIKPSQISFRLFVALADALLKPLHGFLRLADVVIQRADTIGRQRITQSIGATVQQHGFFIIRFNQLANVIHPPQKIHGFGITLLCAPLQIFEMVRMVRTEQTGQFFQHIAFLSGWWEKGLYGILMAVFLGATSAENECAGCFFRIQKQPAPCSAVSQPHAFIFSSEYSV